MSGQLGSINGSLTPKMHTNSMLSIRYFLRPVVRCGVGSY